MSVRQQSASDRGSGGGWLAGLIAPGLGGVAFSITIWLGWDDPAAWKYGQLACVCVTTLSFFIVLPRCSPEVRAWLAGVSRARRVSAWLFVGVVILFAASQVGVDLVGDGLNAVLANGAITMYLTSDTPSIEELRIYGFRGVTIDWLPIVALPPPRGTPVHILRVPLWLIGLPVLWPWWKPRLVWLLGGCVRGHAPLRSRNGRLALVAVILCMFVLWLSYQDLQVSLSPKQLLRLNEGWVQVSRFAGNWSYKIDGGWLLTGNRSAGLGMYYGPITTPRAWDVRLPAYVLPMTCLLWLILAVRPRHRFRRRWEDGLCLQCGYDLRGLKERCTECGQPIEPERLAQLAGDGGEPGRDEERGQIGGRASEEGERS